MASELEAHRAHWTKQGQGHVFQWADQLNDAEKAQLLQCIQLCDPVEVSRVFKAVSESPMSPLLGKNKVQPFPDVTKISESKAEERAKWEDAGYKLIAEGKVALLLLAGGQATRLGAVFPKGMYDIGLPSHRSLFQIQAERCVKLQQLATARTGKAGAVIPWYVMTSPATRAQTEAFLKEKDYFGLKGENVFFFDQGLFPAVTPEGKIIMESKSKIALSPNGNGGLYSALHTSGALADMQKRGVEFISQYCVDNVLIRPADPLFAGFMHANGLDCAAKVVGKAYPEEPVGVLCLIGRNPGVVEYSEIDAESRSSRDSATGELIFNYAHICINSFSLPFLQDIATKHLKDLPFHIARKKIPCANEQGETTAPASENGWKLEMFIFDAFEYSQKMGALEVRRNEEFSPLKNASGHPKDSPETCLADHCRLHVQYVQRAGGIVEGGDAALVEVSPLLSYAGEGLEAVVKGKTYTAPTEIK